MGPIRSWLYAPGNNAKLLEKVFGAGADAVILDLEDAVPDGEKAEARRMVAERIAALGSSGSLAPSAGQPALFVRINHPSTGLAEADVKAVALAGLSGLRVPKVERVEEVQQVSAWLDQAGSSAAIVCNVESALGVWNAREIAQASPRVLGLALGAADFRRDIGATSSPDGIELLHARSQLVLASRVAGVRPPIDTVNTNVHDEDALRRAATLARTLGFFGKSAIHPRQVPIINEIFTPSADEVAWANRILSEYAVAEAAKSGAFQTAGGELIDTAIVKRAHDVLHLASAVSGHA